MNDIRVIAINPGSTSTKIAVYQNTEPIFLKTIRHSTEELAQFQQITDQFQFRKEIIIQQIKEAFDREGISIPFPQRDVHLFQEKK